MPRKPKKEQLTLVYLFALDRSGSMASLRSSVISGFNEWLNGLKVDVKENPDNPHLLCFHQFDSDNPNERVYEFRNVEEVPELTDFQPRGMTPLYDGACAAIRAVQVGKAGIPGKVAVLAMIMTDGQENASRVETKESLKTLMESLEKENWTFAYMGANQDAMAEASKFGTQSLQTNTASWNASPQGVSVLFANAASSTQSYSKSMRAMSNAGQSAGLVMDSIWSGTTSDATGGSVVPPTHAITGKPNPITPDAAPITVPFNTVLPAGQRRRVRAKRS